MNYLFLSYPKSGRTWVFAILGKYIALDKKLPEKDMVSYPTNTDSKLTGFIPLIKSHAGFSIQENKKEKDRTLKFRPKQIISLERNPHDTILSYYHDCIGRYGVKETLDEFIRGPNGVSNFKKYKEFLNEKNPRFRFEYEKIQNDPFHEMEKIVSLLTRNNVNNDLLHKAIEFCSADNLREKENIYRQNKNDPNGINMKSEGSMRKVRKAKVGSYLEEMTHDQIDYITEFLERP